MLSESNFNQLKEKILEQLGRSESGVQCGGGQGGGQDCDGSAVKSISPSSLLVALGLLSGVLEVISVLMDRDQVVQFVLEGSLKRKTGLDRAMDDIGGYSFEEVMKALLGRFG